jgi:hypothetical protein
LVDSLDSTVLDAELLLWLQQHPRPSGSLFGSFSLRGARSKGDQQPDGRVAHNSEALKTSSVSIQGSSPPCGAREEDSQIGPWAGPSRDWGKGSCSNASPMNLAIDLRNVAVPHGLDLPTRSQSPRCCSPHGLDLPTRSWSSRHCSPHRLDLPTRSWSSRRCSPYGPHVLRGSTSLRARSPHGAAVLMGSTSLGARPLYALAVLMGSTSTRARGPHGPAVLHGAPRP